MLKIVSIVGSRAGQQPTAERAHDIVLEHLRPKFKRRIAHIALSPQLAEGFATIQVGELGAVQEVAESVRSAASCNLANSPTIPRPAEVGRLPGQEQAIGFDNRLDPVPHATPLSPPLWPPGLTGRRRGIDTRADVCCN